MTEPDGAADSGPAEPTSNLSALKGMISFFTLFHLDITQRDMDSMDERFHLVPVIGMIFGIITWAVVSAVALMTDKVGYGGGFMAGLFSLAAVFIGSKFLHFDGLTDFGDGMIVSGDKEKHIRALKDSLVGAGGIGVALTVVLVSVAIYGVSPLLCLVFAIPLTEVFVKYAQVVAAGSGEPGHGMAGRQVANTDGRSVMKALLVTAVAGAVVFALSYITCGLLFEDNAVWMDYVFMLLFGTIAATVVGLVMARTANRNFGMVNGDILGATNEISRPVLLFVFVLYLVISVW